MNFNNLQPIDIERVFLQSTKKQVVQDLLIWFDQNSVTANILQLNIPKIILETKWYFIQNYFLEILFQPIYLRYYNEYNLVNIYQHLCNQENYTLANTILEYASTHSFDNPYHTGSLLKSINKPHVNEDLVLPLFNQINGNLETYEDILKDIVQNAHSEKIKDLACECLMKNKDQLTYDTLFAIACIENDLAVEAYKLLNVNQRMMIESIILLAASTKNNLVKQLVLKSFDLIEVYGKLPLIKCLEYSLPLDCALRCLEKLLLCNDVITEELAEIIMTYDDFAIFQKCLDYTSWNFLSFDNADLELMIQMSKNTDILLRLFEINLTYSPEDCLQFDQLVNLITNSSTPFAATKAFELLLAHEECTSYVLYNLLCGNLDSGIYLQIKERLQKDEYFQFVQSLL